MLCVIVIVGLGSAVSWDCCVVEILGVYVMLCVSVRSQDHVYVTVPLGLSVGGAMLCVPGTVCVCVSHCDCVSAACCAGVGGRCARLQAPAREQRRCAPIGCGLASEKLANPAVTW